MRVNAHRSQVTRRALLKGTGAAAIALGLPATAAGAAQASAVRASATAAPGAASGQGNDEAGFIIYNGATTSPILIDSSYGGADDDRDYRQVRRAVQDLRQDVAMVTGAVDAGEVQHLFADDETAEENRLARADQSKVPALATDADSLNPDAHGTSTAVIIGELGQSAFIDTIVDAGKFNEAEQIKGKWEAYATKTVNNPLPGVDRALVIAGSDARGTIYGIYSISQKIGVSPWYWFSDVPVKRLNTITVSGTGQLNDGPDVKYRGIFINDEQQTDAWARAKFPADKGTPDVNYYRHVYELMLRLGLNTLWPALKSTSVAFDAATNTGMYDTGTPINAEAAADYGIIISGAHSQPMLRNSVSEWPPFYSRNMQALSIVGASATAAYDYSINKPALLEYWREALVANQNFEDILVLGIRGVDDSPAAFTPGNPYGFQNVLQMVADAITQQRALITEVYGSATAVPQALVLYEEVLDLYNQGLKASIPDDVTLMWAEDNFGHLRQVPTEAEAARPGGNGIYYHAAYVGAPRDYTWTNSAPLSLMVDQLQRAWNSGTGQYWILNVGDIKPGEMAAELFARLAWHVNAVSTKDLTSTFLVSQVRRDFGLTGGRATAVAAALETFDELNSAKRAEFWGADSFPFSVTSDGDEIQRHINAGGSLHQQLTDMSAQLDPSYRSTFGQQVLYRAEIYRDMAEQYGYFWKNQLAAQLGAYGSAAVYALLSKRARERIASDDQAWDTLSDGKWSLLMRPEDGSAELQTLLDSQYATVASPADGVGAVLEGSTAPGAGTLRFNSASPGDQHFFDVFSRNDVAEEWTAETDAAWITLSQASGKTAAEQRVTVTVDWARLPQSATGTVHVCNKSGGGPAGDPVAAFTVIADRAAVTFQGRSAGTAGSHDSAPEYLEANGYVAIQAQHYAEAVSGADGSQWRPVDGGIALGQDAMEAFPVTASRVDTNFSGTAQLKYHVYFTSTGQFTGTFYRVPTLNEGTSDNGAIRSARTAIGIDDNVPASANLLGCASITCGHWDQNVLRGIEPLNFIINVPAAGWHDIVVYRSDAAVLFSRIVIETTEGVVGDGLIGPVESPNNIAQRGAAQKATVAPLAAEVVNYTPLDPSMPPVTVPVGQRRTIDGLGKVVSAESDNHTAATIAVDHGRLSVIGHRVGTAGIDFTDDNGAWAAFTVTVTRAGGPQLGAYQETNGQVVIDAADALEKSAYASATDSNNGTHTWVLSINGLQVIPVPTDSSKAYWLATSVAQAQALLTAAPTQIVNGGAAPGTPPRLEFTADITGGGTYYLFVNTSNPSDDSDSYHVAVDGQWRYATTEQEFGTDTWYGSTAASGAAGVLGDAALVLSPGLHTISIWAREAGFHLNQIVLSANDAPHFTGFQPASARSE